MAAYRLYSLDGAGRIHFAEPFTAEDDEDAIDKAQDMKLHAVKCEVWREDRLIATLNVEQLRGSGYTR